ncbi:MAG TPA: AIR synthase, partial [Mucilaginibacter sp.]
QQICGLFNIDPRFCIGAGSMIMAVKPESCDNVIQRLQQNNIRATAVGSFTAKEQGYKLVENGIKTDMPYFAKDPYWAAFFNAYKNGWK